MYTHFDFKLFGYLHNWGWVEEGEGQKKKKKEKFTFVSCLTYFMCQFFE